MWPLVGTPNPHSRVAPEWAAGGQVELSLGLWPAEEVSTAFPRRLETSPSGLMGEAPQDSLPRRPSRRLSFCERTADFEIKGSREEKSAACFLYWIYWLHRDDGGRRQAGRRLQK